MTHSNLRVEVQGHHILVAMRGSCLRAKFRKQDAPWLAMGEAANERARELGWVRSCDELHGAVKRARDEALALCGHMAARK
jgi:hypothetical protein